MLDSVTINSAVELALKEDLQSGDLTTQCTIAEDTRAHGRAVAKAEIVACGGEVFRAAFLKLDPEASVELNVKDGCLARPGTVLWSVRGLAAPMLMAERSALNLTQRMSGVATLAAKYVAQLPTGSHTRITDTRKTTPGLRALERYAVRSGGAHNHRDNLGSALLIKDNHIAASGGISNAVSRAKRSAPHTAKIEVEVESFAMLDEALKAGADIVMLDNFDDDAVAEAVKRCAGKALVEVSGDITLESGRIPKLATAGVDVISAGALTHSAPAANISLKIELLAGSR